jgi:hypothetical protein
MRTGHQFVGQLQIFDKVGLYTNQTWDASTKRVKSENETAEDDKKRDKREKEI